MATADEIAALRLLIAEPDNVAPYTDTALSARIDAAEDGLASVAYDIWTEKAAKFSQMVDISEGGSSRKMGDLYEQALGMAAHFAGQIPGGEPTGRPTRLRRLRRSG